MDSIATTDRALSRARASTWTLRAQVLVLCASGLSLFACGGAQPPQARLTSAESAVRAAEVGGAEDIPRGKLHLKYARDQIVEARALMEAKDHEAADLVLQRAEIDAQYALALARQEEATEEAKTVLEEISELMEKAKK